MLLAVVVLNLGVGVALGTWNLDQFPAEHAHIVVE